MLATKREPHRNRVNLLSVKMQQSPSTLLASSFYTSCLGETKRAHQESRSICSGAWWGSIGLLLRDGGHPQASAPQTGLKVHLHQEPKEKDPKHNPGEPGGHVSPPHYRTCAFDNIGQ